MKSNGTVKFYNETKGFGFIRQDFTTDEIYFHKNGCIDAINRGDKVEFEIEQGMKGLSAIRVKRKRINKRTNRY